MMMILTYAENTRKKQSVIKLLKLSVTSNDVCVPLYGKIYSIISSFICVHQPHKILQIYNREISGDKQSFEGKLVVLREMRRMISAKRAHVCNKRSKHFLREVFLSH